MTNDPMPQVPADMPAKAPDSSLKTRLKSAAIFAPPVLVVIYFGGWGFALMLAAAGVIAVREWGGMLLKSHTFPKGMVTLAGVLAGLSLVVGHMLGGIVPGLVFTLSLCFLIFAYNYSQEGPSLRLFLAGFAYIVAALAVMIWLRTGVENGLFHFLTLLLIVWASDSFAYLFGRVIGGPKLAPEISPKKTWAGFVGSSLGAGAIAAVMTCPWLTFGDEQRALAGGWAYFSLGVFLGMVGQVGDLLVSYFKRKYGVKDTGNLIPGHGGILDRIDALLLVALVFGVIVAVMLP